MHASEHQLHADAVGTREPRVVGVIDIGTNAVRLLLAEADPQTSSGVPWRVLADERAPTRLGEKLAATQRLTALAIERTVRAVRAMHQACNARHAEVSIFATAALREAQNAEAFQRALADASGLRATILSSRDEGLLAHESMLALHGPWQGNAFAMDIGGGSVEIVRSVRGIVVQNASLALGAVRLTERFGGSLALAQRIDEAEELIDRALDEHLDRPERGQEPESVAGCGGTFAAIARICGVDARREAPRSAGGRSVGSRGQSGTSVSRDAVDDLLSRICEGDAETLARISALPADRADVLLAGVLVLSRTLRHMRGKSVVCSEGGVRDGMLRRILRDGPHASTGDKLSPLDAHRGASASSPPLLPSRRAAMVREARELAAQCKVEATHEAQVALLASSLHDQLQLGELFGPLDADDRATAHTAALEAVLLESAAWLHDTGMLLGEKKHHKVSAEIVRNAALPSWDAPTREMLAQVCRYHRKSPPSLLHDAFAALPEQDRAMVQRIAAILRIADGLDRSHQQLVGAAVVRSASHAGSPACASDREFEDARPVDAGPTDAGLVIDVQWRNTRPTDRTSLPSQKNLGIEAGVDMGDPFAACLAGADAKADALRIFLGRPVTIAESAIGSVPRTAHSA